MTIELAPDDARIPVIESLLFGKTLPPHLPLPVEKARRVEVPEPVQRFWRRLGELERRELQLLAERVYGAEELERALGIGQRELMGCHSSINRLSNNFGARIRVGVRGRNRKSRKYWMDEEGAELVRALGG